MFSVIYLYLTLKAKVDISFNLNIQKLVFFNQKPSDTIFLLKSCCSKSYSLGNPGPNPLTKKLTDKATMTKYKHKTKM